MHTVKKNLAWGVDYPALVERLRLIFGVSSDESLGQKLGVSRQTILNWKKGEGPTLQTLEQIAEATNVPLIWLLFGVGLHQGKGGTEYAALQLLVGRVVEELNKLSATVKHTLALEIISEIASEVGKTNANAEPKRTPKVLKGAKD